MPLTRLHRARRATSSAGRSSWASPTSASAAPSWARTSSISQRWLDDGHHGEMDYMARHGTKRTPAGRTGAGHAARDLGAHGLHPARHRERVGRAGRRRGRLRVALRAGARLSQADAQPPAETGRPHPRRGRRLRLSRLRGFRAGAGESAGAQRRAGLDRQAHGADQSPTPARSSSSASCTPTCRCRSTQPASAHCGTLHALHRDLPDPGDRRAVPARCASAAFPISRSSCKGSIPEELRAPMGNRIFGCDDCQLVCPWNKFAQDDHRAGFRAAARPRRREAGRAVRMERSRNSSSAPRAWRSAAPATKAGCAISRWRWAMRRSQPTCVEALQRARRSSVGGRARARGVGAGEAARS